jgi:excisionase family DNA binding protein
MHLITAREASQMLGIRLARLYELTRQRLIPSVRMGEKAIRFDETALKEFIQRGGIRANTTEQTDRTVYIVFCGN